MLQGCTDSRKAHVVAEGVAENWPNQVSWEGRQSSSWSSPTTSSGPAGANDPHPLEQEIKAPPAHLPTHHGLCFLPSVRPHQAEGPGSACVKDCS